MEHQQCLCSRCTFENHPSLSKCEVCEYAITSLQTTKKLDHKNLSSAYQFKSTISVSQSLSFNPSSTLPAILSTPNLNTPRSARHMRCTEDKNEWRVGMAVEGNYKGHDRWYPGVIASVAREDGSFDINYDDGTNGAVYPNQIERI